MKQLTPQQIKSLVDMLGQTRDQELNCSECQRNISEYAERQIAGLPLNELLARVEHHLTQCPECTEDFRALTKVLREGQ